MSAVELLDQALAKLDALLGGAKPAGATPAPKPAPAAAAPAPKPAPAAEKTKPNAPKAAPTKATAAAAPAKAAGAASSSEVAELFQKVLIKVAKIISVELVENSEKLYKLQVDVGGETRQVCAGLRQYIPAEELKDRLVTAVCNLKPAKLAGNLSEAMLLAGETETASGLVVKLLEPPAGSQPGDQVYLEGGAPAKDTPKQVKSDHFKAVAAVLKTADGCKATLDGTPLVTSAGVVTVPSVIADGSAIH